MFTSCNLQLTNKAKLKRRDLYNQFLVHVCYHFGKFKLSSPKEVLERWKTEVGIEFLKALLLNASRWLNPKRFFLISKTFLSEIFKLSFAECWMESRKNIMKMCHEHTILIFNFTQHSSGLFCVSVCSVLSNTNTSPSFIFRVQDVAFIASCLYQMLEPLRDEHKLRKPWCVPI